MKSGLRTLEIRPAIAADATAITRVRREAILAKAASHYDRAILEDWADGRGTPVRLAQIERKISDPIFIVLVAKTGDDIIGFAIADLSSRELQALYVKPNQIGRVGRTLLAALEDIAFAAVPFLGCDASLNAEQFYKSIGYLEECRKDHVSSPGGVVSRVVQMKKHRPFR